MAKGEADWDAGEDDWESGEADTARAPATPEQRAGFKAKADAAERAYEAVAPHRGQPEGLVARTVDGISQLPNTDIGSLGWDSIRDFGSSLGKQLVGGDSASAKIGAAVKSAWESRNDPNQGWSDNYNKDLAELQREIEQEHQRSPLATTVMPAVAQGMMGVAGGGKALAQQAVQGGLRAAGTALGKGVLTGAGFGAGGAVANMEGTPGLDRRTLDTAVAGATEGAKLGGTLAAVGGAGAAAQEALAGRTGALPQALTRPRSGPVQAVREGLTPGPRFNSTIGAALTQPVTPGEAVLGGALGTATHALGLGPVGAVAPRLPALVRGVRDYMAIGRPTAGSFAPRPGLNGAPPEALAPPEAPALMNLESLQREVAPVRTDTAPAPVPGNAAVQRAGLFDPTGYQYLPEPQVRATPWGEAPPTERMDLLSRYEPQSGGDGPHAVPRATPWMAPDEMVAELQQGKAGPHPELSELGNDPVEAPLASARGAEELSRPDGPRARGGARRPPSSEEPAEWDLKTETDPYNVLPGAIRERHEEASGFPNRVQGLTLEQLLAEKTSLSGEPVGMQPGSALEPSPRSFEDVYKENTELANQTARAAYRARMEEGMMGRRPGSYDAPEGKMALSLAKEGYNADQIAVAMGIGKRQADSILAKLRHDGQIEFEDYRKIFDGTSRDQKRRK